MGGNIPQKGKVLTKTLKKAVLHLEKSLLGGHGKWRELRVR